MNMNRLPLAAIFAVLTLLAPAISLSRGEDVALQVHADKVANPINPFIYGHFFEHIYNGGDNGLWGEMVWKRGWRRRSVSKVHM